MKKITLLAFALFFFSLCKAQPIPTGDWTGFLKLNQLTLKVIFHVKEENGQWSATMDSPDQSAYGLKIENTIWSEPILTLHIPDIKMAYYGRFGGDSLKGDYTQAGLSVPLTLYRNYIEQAPDLAIQTPVGPFNYEIRQVSFQNKKAGIKLAGTLTLPRGKGPFPAVLLVTGSGPQNRDESIGKHKPFHVLANEFTNAGYAVLRYDDRGVGESEGKFRGANSADFLEDAMAGLDFLRSIPEVNPAKTGLLGHSEGGMLAWMASAEAHKPAFVISLAGPGIAHDRLMLLQTRAVAITSGMDEDKVLQAEQLNSSLYAIAKSEKDSLKARNAMREKLENYYFTETGRQPDQKTKEALDQQLNTLLDPWFRYFIAFDPVPYLRKIDIPVYAANGSLDVQVTANENLRSILDEIPYQKSPKTAVQNYQGLNHLFQSAQSGSPEEYLTLRETFSPQVMADIIAWMNSL